MHARPICCNLKAQLFNKLGLNLFIVLVLNNTGRSGVFREEKKGMCAVCSDGHSTLYTVSVTFVWTIQDALCKKDAKLPQISLDQPFPLKIIIKLLKYKTTELTISVFL